MISWGCLWDISECLDGDREWSRRGQGLDMRGKYSSRVAGGRLWRFMLLGTSKAWRLRGRVCLLFLLLLLLITIFVIKLHDHRKPEEITVRKERVYLPHTFTLMHWCSSLKKSWQELTQGRILEAGADTEDAAFWLTAHSLLSLLFYRIQDHQPRDGTTHHRLCSPSLITSWENALQLDLMEAFPQLRLLSLWWLQPVSSWHKISQYKMVVSHHVDCWELNTGYLKEQPVPLHC